MPTRDARRLRGLPAAWEQPIVESSVDALAKRAEALASRLTKHGRKREADELRRLLALLERVDDLHRHAGDLEMLAGLYRALAAFAHEDDPAAEDSFVWAQTGALGDDGSPVGHGPAFRETAALRNRAFRLVASMLAKYARRIGTQPPPHR
jgi:hypothetical protein